MEHQHVDDPVLRQSVLDGIRHPQIVLINCQNGAIVQPECYVVKGHDHLLDLLELKVHVIKNMIGVAAQILHLKEFVLRPCTNCVRVWAVVASDDNTQRKFSFVLPVVGGIVVIGVQVVEVCVL